MSLGSSLQDRREFAKTALLGLGLLVFNPACRQETDHTSPAAREFDNTISSLRSKGILVADSHYVGTGTGIVFLVADVHNQHTFKINSTNLTLLTSAIGVDRVLIEGGLSESARATLLKSKIAEISRVDPALLLSDADLSSIGAAPIGNSHTESDISRASYLKHLSQTPGAKLDSLLPTDPVRELHYHLSAILGMIISQHRDLSRDGSLSIIKARGKFCEQSFAQVLNLSAELERWDTSFPAFSLDQFDAATHSKTGDQLLVLGPKALAYLDQYALQFSAWVDKRFVVPEAAATRDKVLKSLRESPNKRMALVQGVMHLAEGGSAGPSISQLLTKSHTSWILIYPYPIKIEVDALGNRQFRPE